MRTLLSQIGIFVELVGALYLAYAAYRSYESSKQSIVNPLHWNLEDEDRSDSLEGRLSTSLQEIAAEFQANAREQWRAALVGFVLLALGLALQFAGTLGA